MFAEQFVFPVSEFHNSYLSVPLPFLMQDCKMKPAGSRSGLLTCIRFNSMNSLVENSADQRPKRKGQACVAAALAEASEMLVSPELLKRAKKSLIYSNSDC